MDKEHRVSVYDMVKELNLKEVTPEINSKEVYIEQAEIPECGQLKSWRQFVPSHPMEHEW